ncbi:hypothetical protein [Companilactobacillus sp. HBUAS59699]|uniref:hypothetical protein n=1 Tax=Companilactobacillus sp. HBUAS59699 TaxID=3109358 RepID=UPI002FF04CF0
MRNRKKLIMSILGTILFCVLLSLKFSAMPVRADLDADGRKATPQGLALMNGDGKDSYFTYVDNFMANYPNHATIIRGQNPNYSESDAVQLTSGTKQLSSIWSDIDKGNYINTAIPQKLSMWLYFGHGELPADGIALVLQNDPRKEYAITTYNNKPVDGETLGVWGPDVDKTQTKPSVVAANAIQNSWALEFDTFLNRNSTPELGSYFDYDFESTSKGNQHMAWNYPALAGTYEYNWTTGAVFKLVHNDAKQYLNLTRGTTGDNSWHHLSIDYQPPVTGSTKASLTYSFNDKKTNGEPGSMLSTPADQPYSNTVDLDLANFHFDKDANGVTDTKLRYGFTGSTGASASLNMAVFETMPSLVNASSEVKVYNVSQGNREIKEGDAKSYNNNLIKFSYNLNYLSGQNDLLNTVATINLPKNIVYNTTGDIGNVVYSDGKIEPIPASEVTNGVLSHRLKRGLNNGLKGAKVEITGVTKIETNSNKTTVASAHALIKGDLYKGDLNTPNFYIISEPRHLSIKSTSALNQNIGVGDTANFAGTMSYDDSTVIKNENMSILMTVDNGEPTTYKDTLSKDGEFSLDIADAEKLPVGQHSVNIQVIDQNGIASNVLTYLVNVTAVNPVLSTDNPDLTAVQALKAVNIPAHITYDGNVTFSSTDLTWKMKVMNQDGTQVIKDNISAPIQDEFSKVLEQDLVQNFSMDSLGITEPGKYQIEVYVKDQRDRQSNVVTYNLEYLAKSADLIHDDYAFQSINTSSEIRTVKRAGKWKLGVNSVDSAWSLSAKATDMVGKDAEGNDIGNLKGNMIFVGKDDIAHDMDSYVLIDNQTEALTNDYDISGNWKPTNGILLRVLPNPLGGHYTGLIDWCLSNTI